jgi:hypothetical protein
MAALYSSMELAGAMMFAALSGICLGDAINKEGGEINVFCGFLALMVGVIAAYTAVLSNLSCWPAVLAGLLAYGVFFPCTFEKQRTFGRAFALALPVAAWVDFALWADLAPAGKFTVLVVAVAVTIGYLAGWLWAINFLEFDEIREERIEKGIFLTEVLLVQGDLYLLFTGHWPLAVLGTAVALVAWFVSVILVDECTYHDLEEGLARWRQRRQNAQTA